MKQKFNIITSTCVPLPLENVDTDQIIPARFLKATTREESFFGENLFRDWRYNADGTVNKDFVLNNPIYGGEILVAGKNFGSGSSREHAAWAIAGYGFRVVISSFFAPQEQRIEQLCVACGGQRGFSGRIVCFHRSRPEDAGRGGFAEPDGDQ